ncbi:hypothetical protein EXIGLDRAFT_772988 [Exidia glandulosa HHB12029]|uniref:Secreted protein n=1 Tax=Exidia glandulosa HHB12029 TaxID=1314781 RepID=A0A165F0Q8_EXIGL|nr:hypothetical protein EXIGLDRAFT_772988 [Exidia glandulosa HHB12029]
MQLPLAIVLLFTATSRAAICCISNCKTGVEADKVFNLDAYGGSVPAGAVNVLSAPMMDSLLSPEACCCFATTEGSEVKEGRF